MTIRRLLGIIKNRLRYYLLVYLYRMKISGSAKISNAAKLDTTFPEGIHIGSGTFVAAEAMIFTHDFSRKLHLHTYIGSNCFIGFRSIILPGIRIGDNCIIGAASVVTKDIPSGSIVVGNPARVIKTDIHTTRYGQLI